MGELDAVKYSLYPRNARGGRVAGTGPDMNDELTRLPSYVALRVDHIVLKNTTTMKLLAAVKAVRPKLKPD